MQTIPLPEHLSQRLQVAHQRQYGFIQGDFMDSVRGLISVRDPDALFDIRTGIGNISSRKYPFAYVLVCENTPACTVALFTSLNEAVIFPLLEDALQETLGTPSPQCLEVSL